MRRRNEGETSYYATLGNVQMAFSARDDNGALQLGMHQIGIMVRQEEEKKEQTMREHIIPVTRALFEEDLAEQLDPGLAKALRGCWKDQ